MKHYRTYGKLLEACVVCQTGEDAKKVLANAKQDDPKHAQENIGYLFGYLAIEERQRLYALFPTCSHPIFGRKY